MEKGERLTGRWRAIATVVSLCWIVTAVLMVLLTASGAAHQLTGIALIVAMLAGLPVLTLLKNLANRLAEGAIQPQDDSKERTLTGVSVLMLVAAWALHLFS